jgi:hypothetical protein
MSNNSICPNNNMGNIDELLFKFHIGIATNNIIIYFTITEEKADKRLNVPLIVFE